MHWFPVTDANFDAQLNLWELAYIESICIALSGDFAKKIHLRIKVSVTVERKERNSEVIVIFLTLFTASIYKIYCGISSVKKKSLPIFGVLCEVHRKKITDIITWLSVICLTSLTALFWNFPLLFSHSKNTRMSTLITVIITYKLLLL